MTAKVLITCPPMLKQLATFESEFARLGWQVTAPEVTQTLSEGTLCELVPQHDGWIIGDDPANERVVAAGVAGRLSAVVKWGVGTDNVDFAAFKAAGVPVTHTPGMFGNEVADIALGYLIALARHTFEIHQGVVNGSWPKPSGMSLVGKTCGIVGYGDIGRQLSKRLQACGMQVIAFDPFVDKSSVEGHVQVAQWPENLAQCDFLCFTCALNSANWHMFDAQSLSKVKPGVRIINVARGPLIAQDALIEGLQTGVIAAVALDVFEEEPLAKHNTLREFPQNVFGSHNASNTLDAVIRTSELAMKLLAESL